MDFRTYHGRTLAEVLERVRSELGPDATVLHTRYVATPWLRWLGMRTVELVASSTADVPPRLFQAASRS